MSIPANTPLANALLMISLFSQELETFSWRQISSAARQTFIRSLGVSGLRHFSLGLGPVAFAIFRNVC